MDEKSYSDIRARLSIPLDSQVIGGVMRFSSEKRPDLWVETLISATKQSPNVYGLIVGDGPMRNALMAKVESAGLASRIRFAGRQTPVEPWMSAMDMLFLSSVTEGLPNVLIEAQALGVPVATMNVGGAPETLCEGKSGIILEDTVPENLARQMIAVLESPDRMKNMSEDAMSFVNSRFDISIMVATLKTLYQ